MYYAKKILGTPTRDPGRFVGVSDEGEAVPSFSGRWYLGRLRGCRRPWRWRGRLPAALGCQGRRPRRQLRTPGRPLGSGSPRPPALRPGWTPRSCSSRQEILWCDREGLSRGDPPSPFSRGLVLRAALPTLSRSLAKPDAASPEARRHLHLLSPPLRWGRTSRAVRRRRSYGPLLPRPRSVRGPGAPTPGRPRAPVALPRRHRGGRGLPAARRSQRGPGDRLRGPGPSPVLRRVLSQGRRGWSARRGAPHRSRRPPERVRPRRRRKSWGSPPPSPGRRGLGWPPQPQKAYLAYPAAWRRRTQPDRTRQRRRGP